MKNKKAKAIKTEQAIRYALLGKNKSARKKTSVKRREKSKLAGKKPEVENKNSSKLFPKISSGMQMQTTKGITNEIKNVGNILFKILVLKLDFFCVDIFNFFPCMLFYLCLNLI